jgi:hypothetical protein
MPARRSVDENGFFLATALIVTPKGDSSGLVDGFEPHRAHLRLRHTETLRHRENHKSYLSASVPRCVVIVECPSWRGAITLTDYS